MSGGRPCKEINQDNFESLCKMQCTLEEICGFFNVTDKTLSAWCKRTYGQSFSEIYRQKRGVGKISLRRAQFRLAEKNAAMAIFLGKQYLGQCDTPERDEPDALRQARELLGGVADGLDGEAT